MMSVDPALLIAGVVLNATPIVLAAVGETLTEKSGLINLSLDGTILLSAMVAFVAAFETGSTAAGYAAGAATGAMVAGVVAVFSIRLSMPQVAVGFVLTLMTRDLAYFLGNAYSRIQGPQSTALPIPGLREIPFFGDVLFSHALIVYAAMGGIFGVWWFLQRTSAGLSVRAVGEHPAAAFARAIRPGRVQTLCALAGGAMVGLGGAAFSLLVKPGWGRPQGAEGTGWIALALVIFGGWHPVRAAVGAYLFAFLQVMSIHFQGWMPSVPSQVFQVAPFPLMIFTLVLMSASRRAALKSGGARPTAARRVLAALSGAAPAALGKPFKAE